jgi:hypothetical protein
MGGGQGDWSRAATGETKRRGAAPHALTNPSGACGRKRRRGGVERLVDCHETTVAAPAPVSPGPPRAIHAANQAGVAVEVAVAARAALGNQLSRARPHGCGRAAQVGRK